VTDENEDVYIVRLRRRTLPEQVDYLILQVSFLVARVGTLEREAGELRDTVANLTARLRAVERATPWTGPPIRKTGPPTFTGTSSTTSGATFASNYEEAMDMLQAEVDKLRQAEEDVKDEDDPE
jgi:prefoldin subunit 5